jgi:histidinol-phosphatase (PHP family)
MVLKQYASDATDPTGPLAHSAHSPHWLANYHTHNRWCDGQAEVAEVVEAAIAAGLTQIGISSHAPVPFRANYALPLDRLDAYRAAVLAARETYQDRITVALGLELDALPELRSFNADILARSFDYTVGSVHFQKLDDAGEPWPLDLSAARFAELLRARYNGDIRALVEEHYSLIAALGDYPGVSMIGHIDRGVKLFNAEDRFFREDESWYREAVDGALQALAAGERIVELSTGGWRRGLPDPFPSPWIVRRCRERGIRMTLNSDSHHPDQLTYDYPRALALLAECGHHEIARFAPQTGGWEMTALPRL